MLFLIKEKISFLNYFLYVGTRYDTRTVQLSQFISPEVYLGVWFGPWRSHDIITATAYASSHQYWLSACCISGPGLAFGNKTVKFPDLNELAICSLLWYNPPWEQLEVSFLSEESFKGKTHQGTCFSICTLH